uniref:(northern house mosquito) hypothetical protein n=1 Tax=Culex pipiens TaxID=7175 RepID=A0A8D8F9U5_CULPI
MTIKSRRHSRRSNLHQPITTTSSSTTRTTTKNIPRRRWPRNCERSCSSIGRRRQQLRLEAQRPHRPGRPPQVKSRKCPTCGVCSCGTTPMGARTAIASRPLRRRRRPLQRRPTSRAGSCCSACSRNCELGMSSTPTIRTTRRRIVPLTIVFRRCGGAARNRRRRRRTQSLASAAGSILRVCCAAGRS